VVCYGSGVHTRQVTDIFFDDHPRFLETSTTKAESARLSRRHAVMIERQRELLAGKRVLDIASHDGRWSFSALRGASASHVTGIEARPELVAAAEENMAHYDVDPASYRFISADVFDVLGDTDAHGIDVDVVMCLGFLYHTLRFSDLFLGIRRLAPSHLLLDTVVFPSPKTVLRLFGEDTSKESAGTDNTLAHGGRLLTGRPSVSALSLMLDVHGFEVVEKIDWSAHLEREGLDADACEDYVEGRRVTWLCRPV
jgi:hypothetical protein